MKKTILNIAMLFALFGAIPTAEAKDEVTLQLKWVWQAQFAGYIIAQEKGFYDEYGLDVTIKPAGPDLSPERAIAAGGADVIVNWMPSALAARERGLLLVNILQVFNRAGNNIVCRKDRGIETPQDFKGKTIGIIFSGNEFPHLAWYSKLGFDITGPNPDITILRQGFNVDPILNGQADCISTQIYNEYYQILDAGIPPEDLKLFFFEDYGVATLEDGLYVLEDSLKDTGFVDKMARFVAASIKGWQYAIDNVEESAKIVVDTDPTGVADLKFQTRQLREISKLIAGSARGLGYLEPDAADRTVDVLMSGTVDPVITKRPTGHWTHEVWEKAQKLM